MPKKGKCYTNSFPDNFQEMSDQVWWLQFAY